jgi:uncharacterized phage protein gp47/JayE
MIGDYLDKYTFKYLMESALDNVPDSLDKREGSIIYDALAPACYELAEYYMELKKILENTFASTANNEYLDLRAAEQGLERYAASYAVKRGDFLTSSGNPAVIPIGSRFSVISDTLNINYVVTEAYLDEFGEVVPGAYRMTCEEIGTQGNSYTGPLIPITYIQSLKTATLSDLLVPARDEETDDELRDRYFLAVNDKPFGGNIAQYDEELKGIDGVGEVQIYPVWNGGGSVKLSVIDAEYNIITNDFITTLQNMIDPTPQGTGLGLAPIGHTVTVTTPTEKIIDVTATVVLDSGYTLGQVTPLIEDAIENYLLGLREIWGVSDDLNNYSLAVYIARINAAVLGVAGVANITGTTINGLASDLTLIQNATTQELPVLGTVIVSE